MTGKERFVRLKEYLKTDNLYELSKKIGVSRNALVKAELRTKPFSDNLAKKIVEIYPEIRVEWLIDGDGDMLEIDHKLPKSKYEQNSKPMVVEEIGSSTIDRILRQNEEMLATINRLLSHQETYKDVIKENAESIKNLTSQEKINAQTINNLTQLELKNAETINNLSAGSKNVQDAGTGGG